MIFIRFTNTLSVHLYLNREFCMILLKIGSLVCTSFGPQHPPPPPTDDKDNNNIHTDIHTFNHFLCSYMTVDNRYFLNDFSTKQLKKYERISCRNYQKSL